MLYLLGLLSGLQILDGLMTRLFVSRGVVQEINPLISILAQASYFPLLKLAGAVVCIILLWQVARRFPRLSSITTIALVVFYTTVISWNLHVILGTG
jgi:hypothetical protein